VSAPLWDVYPDKSVEDQLEAGSDAGRAVLQQLVEELTCTGPQVTDARRYPHPWPRTLWRTLIRVQGSTVVYGGIEYVEETHQRIRITGVHWLPGR
jgi:hypothetical protein